MKLGKYKPLTSPYGLWSYENLIGAYVRIKSCPIKPGEPFGFDNEELHKIKEVKFKKDNSGNLVTSIILEDLPENTFLWSNLEILTITRDDKKL